MNTIGEEIGVNAEYSEQGLILAAQRGDREAFASLYESNVKRVYHYLLRRMGQASDAEDVTTEVFIKAMEALPTYEFKGVPFVAWLFRIAHNVAVNQMKKQTRRQEVPLEEVSSDANDPAEQAIRQVTYQEVTGAMSGLTSLQKEVIDSRFVSQLSVAETAKKMKRSQGGIRVLQHSAVKALQRILKHNEQEANSNER